MSRLRNNKQSKSFIPTITLTPLIDTVLVLLVVFMVTSPCKIITLPGNSSKKTTAQKARADDYRVSYIYVGNDGTIVANGAVNDQKSVIKMIPALVQQSPIKTIFIQSQDSSTNTKIINALVDAIHTISGARVIVS